jgi:hypothetical protein
LSRRPMSLTGPASARRGELSRGDGAFRVCAPHLMTACDLWLACPARQWLLGRCSYLAVEVRDRSATESS